MGEQSPTDAEQQWRAVIRSTDERLANLGLATWMARRGKDPGGLVHRALGFEDTMRGRALNSAETGWLSARHSHAIKEWWPALRALEEALRAHPDRPEFRALCDLIERAKRKWSFRNPPSTAT